MRNRIAELREGQNSADALRVSPCDWSALGARIRQMAMTAATLHLAERAESLKATARPPQDETKD